MSLPLGRGISLRPAYLPELAEGLINNDKFLADHLDWVELVPENFMERDGEFRRALSLIAEAYPITLHSVSISIGSIDPLDWEFLGKVKTLVDFVKPKWVTDHISYSSVNGFQFNDLIPLPFSRAAARHVAERAKQVQDFLGVPFGLENPSYYKVMPGAEMSEAEFISEIVAASGCRMLLDVNNVYVNAYNHTNTPLESAREYLRHLPLNNVVEVHLAGHDPMELAGRPMLLDTHGAPVPQPVRALLKELNQLMPVETILLEREGNIPPLVEIIAEVAAIWDELRNSSATVTETLDYAPHILSSVPHGRTDERHVLPYVSHGPTEISESPILDLSLDKIPASDTLYDAATVQRAASTLRSSPSKSASPKASVAKSTSPISNSPISSSSNARKEARQ
jgi:uncharacterized protein (UPF0276 family)